MMSIFTDCLKYPTPLKIWMLFIVLFPFYFFKSGLPQVADYILAILICYEFATRRKRLPSNLASILSPLVLFSAYAILVQSFCVLLLPGTSGKLLLYLFPLFYVYNTMVVWLILRLYSKMPQELIRSTLAAIVVSVTLQLILMPLFSDVGVRGSLFFNNPNQLGYYSLIALSIYLFLERTNPSPILLKSLFFVGIAMLAATSSSKAALVSAAILIPMNLIESGTLGAKQFLGGVIAVGLLAGLVSFTDAGNNYYERSFARLENIGNDGDDTFEMRGYDRIWNHPEYLLLGAGEGGWDRFYTDLNRRYEMHSTFGTILFSYGVPGSLFFMLFIVRVFRGRGVVAVMYSLPLFSYGLTHMGLRATLFWVFFAMVATSTDYKKLSASKQS